MSEARVDRLDRLEEDVREIKATLVRLEPLIIRIDERVHIELPHLATKAELTTGLADLRDEIGKLRVEVADKPGRGYLWGVMGAMVGAQAIALAAAAGAGLRCHRRPRGVRNPDFAAFQAAEAVE